jgi:hypothetical protein
VRERVRLCGKAVTPACPPVVRVADGPRGPWYSFAPMEPRLTPAENARKVTAIFALMFGVIPMSFFYYSIERNVRTRRSLAKSCAVIDEVMSSSLSDDAMVRLYGEQSSVVKSALLDSRNAHCDDVSAELSWWMWNVKRGFELDAPLAMREHVRELPGEVTARCSAAFPGEDAHLCASRVAVIRGLLPVPSESLPAWEWASRVSAISREIVAARGEAVGHLSPY